MITATELRDARLYAELTQQQLAEKIGVSLKTIGNWESKGVPPRDDYRVRRALGMVLDIISANSEQPAAAGNQGGALSSVSDYALLDELARRLAQRRAEGESAQNVPSEAEAFKLGAVANRE